MYTVWKCSPESNRMRNRWEIICKQELFFLSLFACLVLFTPQNPNKKHKQDNRTASYFILAELDKQKYKALTRQHIYFYVMC